jgi:Ferritin-like domain
MQNLSRRKLMVAGATLLVPALMPGTAQAAPSDGDLAYLRLLVGAELLAIDFHTRALRTKGLGPAPATYRRSLADERAHYAALARLLTAAGQPPATAADVNFVYPRRSFSSPASIARLAWRIETLLLGAYLGAVEAVEAPELRLPVGQIAASEAQHLSALAPLAGRSRIGRAFPAALTISTASTALDAFES